MATHETPAPEPHAEELPDPGPRDAPAPSLSATVTAAEVLDLGGTGPTMDDAERFALAFTQLQTDSRTDHDHEALITSVASRSADPDMIRFLLEDMRDQRGIGTQRHIDLTEPLWFRSAFTGREDSPTSAQIEVVGTISATVTKELQGGVRLRADVAREGDEWKILSYAISILTLDPIETQPDGEAWRRVPVP